MNLLVGRPIVGIDTDMELTTPTGAAIVAALAGHFGAAPAMTIAGAGFGAGTRELPGRPNVTGVLIGTAHGEADAQSDRTLDAAMTEMSGADTTEELVELAANLDDVSGEVLGHAIDALLGAGALDAWAVPIVMKKGRPAHTLTALCRLEDVSRLADLAAQLTGTLGLRARTVVRTALERHTSTVALDGHAIRVKHGPHRSKPEWDDVVAAAEALNRTPADIAREASTADRRRATSVIPNGVSAGEASALAREILKPCVHRLVDCSDASGPFGPVVACNSACSSIGQSI